MRRLSIAAHRQGQARVGRVQRRERIHCRPHGRSREHLGAQGDTAGSHGGRRDRPSPSPSARRIDDMRRYRGSSTHIAGSGSNKRRRSPPRRRGPRRSKHSARRIRFTRTSSTAHREGSDALELPARTWHAAAARAHDRASLEEKQATHSRFMFTTSILPTSQFARNSSLASDLGSSARAEARRSRRRPQQVARAGDRRRPLPRLGAVRHVRRAHDLLPYAGVQRSTARPVAGQLRFSMIGPGIDVSFVDDARKRFVAESASSTIVRPRRCASWRGEPHADHSPAGSAGRLRRSARVVGDKIREIF